MDNSEFAKKIVRFITFPAVRHIVAGAVGMNVPQRNTAEKVLVFYGTVVISSAIAEATVTHVERKIDDFAAWYKTATTAPELEVEES